MHESSGTNVKCSGTFDDFATHLFPRLSTVFKDDDLMLKASEKN